MLRRTKPATYEHRSFEPAVIAALQAGLVAVLCSTFVTFILFAPEGWRADGPFRADLLFVLRQLVTNIQLRGIFGSVGDTLYDLRVRFDLYDEITWRLHAIGTSAVAAFPFAGIRAFKRTRHVDTRTHHAGLRFWAGRAGISSAIEFLASEIEEHGSSIRLAPKIWLPRMRELRNLLLVGAPNSGKTRIILFWLNEILGRLKDHSRERLLVHDTTGEILRGMPIADDAIAAFHPTKKGGHAWIPGRDVRSMTSTIALATRLVGSDGTTQGDNRVFDKGGTTILTGCIAETRAACGPNWSFADLLNTLLGDPVAWKERFARVYPPAAALILIDADGNLNRTSASFILSVRAHVMQLLDPLARAWGAVPPERQFSFLDWIEGKKQGQPTVVVLQRSAANPALSALWIGSIVDFLASHACDESFNADKSMRIRFVLDEIHQLGPLPRLQEILDVGRNKGVSVVAALQDMTQLRRTYGADGAKEFLGRFATKIIGQAQIGPDADELAASFVGTREIMPKRAASYDAAGSGGEPEPRTVGIVRPEYLAYDLGANDEEVCAVALGIGDVVELSWPTTVWEPRR